MKTLVVYFSRKGYVRRIAQRRAQELGADVCELKTTERIAGFLGFWWCGRFGMHKWGMPLQPVSARVEDYDKVIVCAPIWVFTVCAPMREFLRQSAGKIRAADYILVHFNPLAPYRHAADRMDQTLGVKREHFESIACPWGRQVRTHTI